MYPKSKHGESRRASRPRKRHFHGNRYSKKDYETEQSDTAEKSNTSNSNDVIYNLHNCRIVDFFTVFSTLAQILICKQCTQSVQFEENGVCGGSGFKLIVKCSCGRTEINSGIN